MIFAARASLSDNAKALSYCSCSSSWRESSRLLPSHSTHSPASVFIGSVYRYWRFVHHLVAGRGTPFSRGRQRRKVSAGPEDTENLRCLGSRRFNSVQNREATFR